MALRAGLNPGFDQVQWVPDDDANGAAQVACPEICGHRWRVSMGKPWCMRKERGLSSIVPGRPCHPPREKGAKVNGLGAVE